MLVRARDETRLPCEYGANPFSGFRDIYKKLQFMHTVNGNG